MHVARTLGGRTQEEMAAHIGQYHWDHFVTLTHRFSGSEARQLKQVKTMVRKLERIAQQRVCFVSFSERTTDGHLHHHVLLQGTAHLPLKTMQRKWPWGITKFEAYDRKKGGADYASKAYGTHAHPELQSSDQMPPRWDEPVAEAPQQQPRVGHHRARMYREDRYGRVQKQSAKATVVQRLPSRRRPAA
jgi:hypothetical protein